MADWPQALPSATKQGQSPTYNALTNAYQADDTALTQYQARAISVLNQCVDPRATTAANFSGAVSLGPPAAPTVSAAGTGHTVPAGNYIVAVSYTAAVGETLISPPVEVTVASGQQVTVTSPPSVTNAASYCVYMGQVNQGGSPTGALTRQATTALGTSTVIAATPTTTGSAPLSAATTTTSALTQTPTQRTDGNQQQAATKSCQEVIGTVPVGSYIAIQDLFASLVLTSKWPTLVAGRLAFKIQALAGATSYHAELVLCYYQAGNSRVQETVIWSESGSRLSVGTWYVAEGFDSQTPIAAITTTCWADLELRIYNDAGASGSITLRATEWVTSADPDGDIPGYAGGDVSASTHGLSVAFTDTAAGNWLGTTDNSQSVTEFDPVGTYAAAAGGSDFGFNNFMTLTAGIGRQQTIKILREMGATLSREDGVNFSGNQGPTSAPTAAAQSGAGLGIGYYRYFVTNVTSGVESVGGTEVVVQTTSGNQQVALSGIVAGPAGTTARKIYRTTVQGSNTTGVGTEKLVATINDNTTTTYTDTTADASLGAAAPVLTISATQIAWFQQLFAAGIKVILCVGPPSWMLPSNYGWPTSALFNAIFANSVASLISQLGPSNVYGIQPTDEPNNPTYGGTSGAADPASYTAYSNAIYNAIHTAYPTVKLHGGILSWSGTFAAALSFYNSMMAAGALFDVLDVHPYPVQGNYNYFGLYAYAGSSGRQAPGWAVNAGIDMGFDACLRQIKDAQAAQGDTKPLFISETGQLSTSERLQGQVQAFLMGRLRRDSKVLGVCFNAFVTAPATTANQSAGDWGALDPRTLRRRHTARQIALMRGMPNPTYDEKVDIEAAFSSVRILREREGAIGGAVATVTNGILYQQGYLAAGSAGSAFGAFYFDPADIASFPRLAKLRMRGVMFVNAVAPGTTFYFQMFPVSGTTGASGVRTGVNVGTATSVGASLAPAVGSNQMTGVWCPAPAAGYYALCVSTGATTATGSDTEFSVTLEAMALI